MPRDLVLGGAILAGCCVIALGVYLGLRERPIVLAAPPAGSEAAAIEPPRLERPRNEAPIEDSDAGGPADARGSTSALSPVVPRSPEQIELSRLLDAQKPALRKACWDPAFAKNPSPSKAEFVYDVAFAPDGHQVARGISEPAGVSRSDVARCLGEQPLDLTLTPPGHMVQVRVTLSLP